MFLVEWWNSLDLALQIFYCIAIPATLVLLIQTFLMFIGIGDGDADFDAPDVDFNSDGIPDIPLERAFPSYTVGDKTETLYYIEWYNVKDSSKIMNAYTSSNEKFILQLDDAWTDKITVQKDKASDRQIHFYQLSESGNTQPAAAMRLFSITIAPSWRGQPS